MAFLLSDAGEDQTRATVVCHEAEGSTNYLFALRLVLVGEDVVLRADDYDRDGAQVDFASVFVLAPHTGKLGVERCDFRRICLVQIFQHSLCVIPNLLQPKHK